MSNNIVASVTRAGRIEPFDLQVARNQIMGHSTVNIYGVNAAIGTSYATVWEIGNTTAYAFPASAASMNLASSVNTGADKTGTTVLIQGLDSTYTAISETLTLNGTTAVATVKSYLRINSISIASVTNSTMPTGTITLKDSTNTTTYAQITAGNGRSQMSLYTVPAGYTFYLERVNVYTDFNGSSSAYVSYRNYTTTSTGVVNITQQAPVTIAYEARRIMPRPFLEKTDIQLQAKASTGTTFVSIAAEGYLIQDNNNVTGVGS